MRKLNYLIIFLLCSFAFGQWTDDYGTNTLVADGTTSDIQSVGTNDGKTYVIYWDEDGGYDLRVQLLDADGNQLFGANGILANDAVNMSTWTATRAQAVDADGNLYIGFTGTGDSNGYVNKISPEGEQLFGSGGINLGEGWNLNVLPTADGGVIVGWESGTTKLMRYDSSGNAVWDAPIDIVSPDPGKPFTAVGDMVALSDGSFILIIDTKGTSWMVDAIAWAQRFDADGNPMWDDAVQISTITTRSNMRYKITQQNDVTYYAYYGATGFRFDGFLQRINADGTLPWGENGTDFGIDDNYYEMNIKMAADPTSDYIWAVSDICNSSQSEYGISVQKFDKETGEVQLDEFGQTVFPVTADNWVSEGDLQLVDDKPLFMFANDISNGVNSIQLGVVYLDENGEFAWDDEYEMIATSTGNKSRFDFTQNIDGQSVAVWTEPRDGATKAYAQNYRIEPVETNDPCEEKIIMECGETYTVTLNPDEGEWVNYTDVTWDYTGSEQVFEFTASETGTYTFEVNEGENDADFFLMDACSNTANNLSDGYWTGGQNETIDLVAGTTYYLIADLYTGSSSPSTVTVKVTCPEDPGPGDCSQEFTGEPSGGGGSSSPYMGANDIDVEAGVMFNLETVSVDVVPLAGEVTTFDVYIYEDSDGPGNDVNSYFSITPSSVTPNGMLFDAYPIYTVDLELPAAEPLSGGTDGAKYWIAVVMGPSTTNQQVFWIFSPYDSASGSEPFYQSPDDGLTWAPYADADTGENAEGVMAVSGICGELGVSDMNSYDFAYYPNPVKDILNIETQKPIENVSVHNLAGQTVMQNLKAENGQVNMSGLTPGVYVFRVTLQGGQVETFKIIKK